MVSLKDIARACGVSVATVSKALNGQQDIGDATRQRVFEAARELGYTANSAARALKTNRSYDLGVLFIDLQNHGFMHEYFAATLNSFRIESERCGYDLSFINSDLGHSGASYLQHALYRRVDGVAVICADYQSPMVQELVLSDLPVVTLDHAFNNRAAVLSDNMRGMEALVRYIYERGHRRIAYIHGNPTAVTENRLRGFYRACEALKLEIPKEYLVSSNYHEPESCYRATKELLALWNRPTCILFPDDYAWLGGMNAIREAGLRIPEDISVAGYDGLHLAQALNPPLTTWHQNSEELGKLAASMLIERVEHPRTAAPEHVEVPGYLIEGGTVANLTH